MEIILLRDIPKLGKKYDLKNVRDGYGRNFLLPQKMAVLASSSSIKNLEKLRKDHLTKQEKTDQILIKSLEALHDKEIIIKENANEKGELFGSVSKEDILNELKKHGFEILEDNIVLEKNIKHIGEYDIEIKVKDKSEIIKLKVLREE